MTDAVRQIYRRGLNLAATWPWLFVLPVLAELAQHTVEIRLGMYAGRIDATTSPVRLAFGVVKVLSVVTTMVVAWRLWRFAGDVSRALCPSGALIKGLGLFLLVQLIGDAAALLVGKGLIAAIGGAGRSTGVVLTLVPLSTWLLASAALIPWYVALTTEDRTITLRRSVLISYRRMIATWGTLFAGSLPLMIVHYALGYEALGGAMPVWLLMFVDAAVVGLLTAVLAATYFSIFERALESRD